MIPLRSLILFFKIFLSLLLLGSSSIYFLINACSKLNNITNSYKSNVKAWMIGSWLCIGIHSDPFVRLSFCITIIESMEDYGLFVWPFSIVLAEHVWQQRLPFFRVSVVEHGAGTSLPGLIAAKVGLDVTLTDDANRLEVLANMRSVSDLNNLNCNVMGLTWGVWNADIFPCALSYRIQY